MESSEQNPELHLKPRGNGNLNFHKEAEIPVLSKSTSQRLSFLWRDRILQQSMRAINDIVLDARFEKQALAESQTRQSNEMFVDAPGDDGEFGLDVDGWERCEKVVEETSCLVDY